MVTYSPRGDPDRKFAPADTPRRRRADLVEARAQGGKRAAYGGGCGLGVACVVEEALGVEAAFDWMPGMTEEMEPPAKVGATPKSLRFHTNMPERRGMAR